jgi:DNA-binding XRE family transcriptional regulator
MLTRDKLVRWRVKQKLSQAAAARLAEIWPSAWCDIENGDRLPNLEQAFKIEQLTEGTTRESERSQIKAKAWIGQPTARRTKKRAA